MVPSKVSRVDVEIDDKASSGNKATGPKVTVKWSPAKKHADVKDYGSSLFISHLTSVVNVCLSH
jgi:hypothetical protein